MTVASEITRLQTAKANARTSIINKGVDVPANATLDTYHTYIDMIQQGGELESVIQYIRDNGYISLNLWRETWDARSDYSGSITTNTDTVFDGWTILAFNTSFIRNSQHGMRSIATAYGYKNGVFRKAHLENGQTQNTNQGYWGYNTNGDGYLWYNYKNNYGNHWYRVILSENASDCRFEYMGDDENPGQGATYQDRYSGGGIKTVQIPVGDLTANWSMNAQGTGGADVLWYIA